VGRRVIVDVEANGWNWDADKIWCIVCKDIDTNEIFVFRPRTLDSWHIDFEDDFREFIKSIDTFIGHNIVGYDAPTINRILKTNITVNKVEDTLIMSRLFRPTVNLHKDTRFYNRSHGHSLEAWGNYLGYPKLEFNDFSKFSEEMLTYCIRDVNVTHKVYNELLKESEGFSSFSIRLEHNVADLLRIQEDNGFTLDKQAALNLVKETDILINQFKDTLHTLFPPVKKLIKNYKPLIKKDGSIGSRSVDIINKYSSEEGLAIESKPDGSYDLFEYEVFNPASGKQVCERLLSLGWKPKKFTDKGNPKTDSESLMEAIEELSEYPEVSALGKYKIIENRNTKARTWLELSKERGDGKVHGRVNPIGAGTHRCSHYDDNMANVASVVSKKGLVSDFRSTDFNSLPKFSIFDNNKVFLSLNGEEVEYALKGIDGDFGWDSRACWVSSNPPKTVVVGADASGIQLRALAHYMNDPEYTKNLLIGDIHTVHQLAAGISSRSLAKTFIYAWLLGAGDPKIGTIVGVSEEEYEDLFKWGMNTKNNWGQPLIDQAVNRLKKNNVLVTKKNVAISLKGAKVKEQFLDRTPALKRLKTEDIPEVTKRGYLIGLDGRKLWIPNEHLAMSLYLQGFEAVIMKMAMFLYSEELNKKGIYFKQLAFVHDEWVVETYPEYADEVGKTMVESIRNAGKLFSVNCPLDGQYRVGSSWAMVH